MKNIRTKLKTPLTSENKNPKVDDESGNISDSSDISTFTDMKVFKGAFKNLNKINQVHIGSQKNLAKPLEEQYIRNKTDEKFEENGRILPINCEFNPNDNSPISFRNHSELSGNISQKIIKESHNTQKKIDEIMNRLSRNESIDHDDSKGSSDLRRKDKRNDERFLKIIRDSFEEAEINGRSNSLNRLDRKGKYLKHNNNLLTVDKKSMSFIDVQCTLAKIEKGVAVFVSSEHCIFTFPANILPRNVQCGNVYEVSVKETLNDCVKYSDIQKIQEKFMR